MLRTDWCVECDSSSVIIEEFEEQVGYEERAYPVWVIILACGHQLVTPMCRG